MDAIEVDATVTAEATHDRVTFRLASDQSDAVAVRLEQPLVAGLESSQVAIDAEYETEPWSASGDSIEFIRRLDPGETVETGYAIGGVGTGTVREMLRAVTIEVRDLDGIELGILEGTDLPVDGRRIGAGDPADLPGKTDLPASVSDYVLQDVDEVDSSEFEWTPVDDEDTSKGFLRRVLPFL